MSKENKQQAIQAAKLMLAKLNQKNREAGFDISVWENIGWHYAIGNGFITVYPYGEKYFTLMSLKKGDSGGQIYWTHEHEEFDDINKAIEHQIEKAVHHVDLCNKAILTCKGIIQ